MAENTPEHSGEHSGRSWSRQSHHHHHPTPPVTPPVPPTPPVTPPVSPTPPAPASSYTPTSAPAGGFTFTDEFTGTAGSAPSSKNWGYDLGAGGWGNNELETYVNSTANAYLDGSGHLAITATANGSGYNSARLTTKGKFQQMYGGFEAGIWLDPVVGTWPAFWLLGPGPDDGSASWPLCGELDIFESYGESLISCTINNGTVGWAENLEVDTQNDGQWHVYKCEWAEGTVSMYKDGKLLQTQTPKTIGGIWPYDSSADMGGGLYIILNVAVGGTGTNGVKPAAKSLPATPMLVDYVHAWQTT
jgi:beta-glucanase (GH16 family)